MLRSRVCVRITATTVINRNPSASYIFAMAIGCASVLFRIHRFWVTPVRVNVVVTWLQFVWLSRGPSDNADPNGEGPPTNVRRRVQWIRGGTASDTVRSDDHKTKTFRNARVIRTTYNRSLFRFDVRSYSAFITKNYQHPRRPLDFAFHSRRRRAFR